jgi:hypothetical protein
MKAPAGWGKGHDAYVADVFGPLTSAGALPGPAAVGCPGGGGTIPAGTKYGL